MKTKLLIISILAGFLSSCGFFGGDAPSLTLIPYKSADKWGYIDREGKILINPQFNTANVFVDGIALVANAESKYGYIGVDGKYKINPTYKSATFFSEGLACVVPENGKPQFIDESGNVKFTVNEGKWCGIFKDGLARVVSETKDGNKYGYLDKEGKMKINAQFDAAMPFSEGLAAVASKNKETGETKWGYIDDKGSIVISYQFKNLNAENGFSEGLALVNDGKKFGFIDKVGKYIINPQFDGATSFKNGFALIQQGSMVGYIDKEGKIVINPQFSDASYFSGSMAKAASSDRKYGYIDKEGKFIINPQFESGTDFFGDIAFVENADKWGIIDKKGKYLVNPQFDRLNVDFESYKNDFVESDYFDVALVVDNFLDGTDNKNFRKLSGETTLAELRISYPGISINDYSWMAYANDNTELNDYSYLSSSQFTFSESPSLGKKPVYKTYQEYDYWKSKYITKQRVDHYENIPNDNAPLQSVTFYFNLKNGKANQKSDLIFKAIIDGFTSKASVASSGSSNVFENANMRIVVGGSGMGKGSVASYTITFIKADGTSSINGSEEEEAAHLAAMAQAAADSIAIVMAAKQYK